MDLTVQTASLFLTVTAQNGRRCCSTFVSPFLVISLTKIMQIKFAARDHRTVGPASWKGLAPDYRSIGMASTYCLR